MKNGYNVSQMFFVKHLTKTLQIQRKGGIFTAGFGGSIKLQGETEYRKALNQITQNLREVSSQMKVVSSAYDKSDKSTASLNAKSEVLNKKLEEQKSKLELLKNRYNELSQTEDKNSKAMSDLRVAMNNAQADINKTTKEIDNLGKETEDTTKQVKNAGDGFTVFKGILANLGTQAINGAIRGLKSMGSALISVGKQALASYADYEQLVGGVDTLFKESSKVVQEYANNAYKTAGLSANQYMEQVTSFSASLISSLGGDTKKAAEYGNRAMIDMADNANKMGTSMEMITNAYQGFAKQNYTMLDNLKLGYGGTKTEMQRLIQDAAAMTDVQKELGVTVDANSMSFGNIVNAISVMQKSMGIAGTTAKEASTTITGSVNSMKAAWQNLLTGIADDNANFDQLVNNFVDSLVGTVDEGGKRVGGVLNNILPRVITIIKGMGTMISSVLTTLVPELITMIPPLIQEGLPILISSLETAIKAILDVLPTIMDTISQLIPQIVTMLISMLPQLIDAGIKMILSLIQGLIAAIPQLLAMLPDIITKTVKVLMDNLPLIIDAGVQLLMALIKGIVDAIPQLIAMLSTIIDTIINGLISAIPQLIDAAIQLLMAIIDAIPVIIDALIVNLPKIIDTIVNGLINAIPQIIDGAIKLLMGIIQAIPKIIIALVENLPKIITTIVTTLVNNLPKVIQGAIQLLMGIIKAIPQIVIELVKNMPQIIKAIVEGITAGFGQIKEVGGNLIRGLWEGISNVKDWIWGKIKGFCNGIIDNIKSFFGIHSPSTLFRDEIGENLALGVGEGFSNEMENVTKEMQDAMPKSLDTNITTNGLNGMTATNDMQYNNQLDLINAFKEALSQMKIELDDENMGKFVDNTVTRLIYT